MSLPEIPHTIFTPITPQHRPYITIVEQPFRYHRFRYTQEGRPIPIPGASSTPENKTSVAIQVHGYEGRLRVIVSCVTRDPPYRQHPYQLVGRKCQFGVCYFEEEVTAASSTITLPKMAVRCLKRAELKESLRVREEKNVDPFQRGFQHNEDVKSLDLTVVRLCVQVVLLGENGNTRIGISPIVSDPVYNKRLFFYPFIHKLSHCSSYVDGKNHNSEQIILLGCKVVHGDIRIRFFETMNDQVVWEDFGSFQSDDIYNKTAICFKPPKYHNQDIVEPVTVWVQLVRPSDEAASSPVEFEYLPLPTGTCTNAPGIVKESKRRNTKTVQLVKRARMDINEPFPMELLDLIPDQLEVAQNVKSINQRECSSSSGSIQSDHLTGA